MNKDLDLLAKGWCSPWEGHHYTDFYESGFDDDRDMTLRAYVAQKSFTHVGALGERFVFDIVVSRLVERKRIAGRQYFSPAPIVVHNIIKAQISGWHCHPAKEMALLSNKENAMGLEHHWILSKTSGPSIGPSLPVSNDAGELVRELEQKIRFLELQLQEDRPYLKLYRAGAVGLLSASVSLAVWVVSGLGIPFHPLFAAGVIPVSLGVIVMAFLVRGAEKSTVVKK